MPSSRSVSYTHLDVYKRQPWKTMSVKTVQRCSTSVSYTHLDVYKRQLQTFAALGMMCRGGVLSPLVGPGRPIQ